MSMVGEDPKHEQQPAEQGETPTQGAPLVQAERDLFEKMEKDAIRLLNSHAAQIAIYYRGELAQMASDLADANHWRERHSNDSDARGKQSHEHWLKWRDVERRVRELEAKLAAAEKDAAEWKLIAGGLATRVLKDAKRYV